MNTVDKVISKLPKSSSKTCLPPVYSPDSSRVNALALAVASMKDHMTDEGWQIMQGLSMAGYYLAGHRLPVNETDIEKLLDSHKPSIVFLQDKREWDRESKNFHFRDPNAHFDNISALKQETSAFKLTILKDAHNSNAYHRGSAEEIGAHAWVIYYHPRIVKHLAGFVRPKHLIRTWHSLDSVAVPLFGVVRKSRALLSGAISSAYPLRRRILALANRLPYVDTLKHPGYNRGGCRTPEFLETLNKYKVAICTSSAYGYSLRKVIEATACGCKVITDHPIDDPYPVIDGNLVRIDSDADNADIEWAIHDAIASYNEEEQRHWAQLAIGHYAWPEVGLRLADDILRLKEQYNG